MCVQSRLTRAGRCLPPKCPRRSYGRTQVIGKSWQAVRPLMETTEPWSRRKEQQDARSQDRSCALTTVSLRRGLLDVSVPSLCLLSLVQCSEHVCSSPCRV